MTAVRTAVAAGAAFFLGVFMLIVIVVSGGGSPAFAGIGYGTGISDKVPAAYRQWVLAAGALCAQFPPSIVAAQLEAESGWNPNAVSPVGAQGIAQFMPGTWTTWGRDADGNGQADPFDPADAIMAQGRYDCALAGEVKGVDSTVDSTQLALAAYNAGPGAVRAAGGIPAIPETQAYVAKIIALAPSYAAVSDAGPFVAATIAAAKSQLGMPYVWGGGSIAGPTMGGFDCSGLVLFAVYQGSGGTIVLPRTADQQIRAVTRVAAETKSYASLLQVLQPGDLVAMRIDGDTTYHHIAIYIGNGQVVQAPQTGDFVKISPLSNWAGQNYQAGRVA